jgi:hypothetical protein
MVACYCPNDWLLLLLRMPIQQLHRLRRCISEAPTNSKTSVCLASIQFDDDDNNNNIKMDKMRELPIIFETNVVISMDKKTTEEQRMFDWLS